jgi:hypothetical protein
VQIAAADQISASSVGPPASGRYFQGTLVVGSQSPGTPNAHVSPPIEGTFAAGSGGVGFFLTPTLAVEGEIGLTTSITVPQHWIVGTSLVAHDARSRDTFVGGRLRARPRGTRFIEYLAGGGFNINRFTRSSIVETKQDSFPTVAAQPDDTDEAGGTFLEVGIAVALPIGHRLELAPGFVFRQIQRDGTADFFGVGQRAYQVTTTLRLRR